MQLICSELVFMKVFGGWLVGGSLVRIYDILGNVGWSTQGWYKSKHDMLGISGLLLY